MHLHVIRTFPAKLFTAGSIPPSIPFVPTMGRLCGLNAALSCCTIKTACALSRFLAF
jgi:hypothetical protein